MNIEDICKSFKIDGDFVGSEELSTGIINRTYHVYYLLDNKSKSYIIQRINTNVFREPEKVMENIVRVTDHIRNKMDERGIPTKTSVLRAFDTVNGNHYFIDDEGNYWRCYRFIKNSATYDTSDDLKIIEGAGSAFGRFQNMLNDFDAKTLYITIPDFHNTIKRYVDFKTAVKNDSANRVNSVKEEINQLLDFEKEACLLQNYLDNEIIPYRVTHNDTKCNNVCFDKTTGEPLAVLDLDTVMPGAIAHDFGDAIRFIANKVIEDDPKTELAQLDLVKYEAFAKGFLGELKHTLTENEKSSLNLGVFAMTVELAMRFLTDYINGDKYFKTKYDIHNLIRARNQLHLARDIKNKMADLDVILFRYI